MWGGLALSLVSGAAVSIQSFTNGHLGQVIGSPAAAAAVNNGTALLIVLCLALVSGAVTRAWRELRSGRNPVRIWWFFGGLIGATAVFANAMSAPVLGVALLAVAMVLGKLIGSLVTDALGLGPAGRQLPTPQRMAGAACALAGVVISAVGHAGQIPLVLVVFLVAVGALVSIQQAGNAHLAQATGEPLAMGLVNFVGGAAALSIPVAIIAVDGGTLGPVPSWGWVGGALGAGIAIASALAAYTVGVLRLVLGMIAGQSAIGLLLDLAFPRSGSGVTAPTLAGVLLACGAVLIANLPVGDRASGRVPAASGTNAGERT
ncbi:DMT family transporter [Arthrobacter sulfonylureivorans]|uniref:DMT family transporter n=1 Tax=Arthrobacter TaxID=1663 RepID=UPI001F0F9BCC|nr:DMT family transporter [Arthrobacter sp. CAU 1506]